MNAGVKLGNDTRFILVGNSGQSLFNDNKVYQPRRKVTRLYYFTVFM